MVKGKIAILVFLVLLGAGRTFAQQNLVPNPSFEDNTGCPNNIAQIFYCPSWTDWSILCSSVDYYNACSILAGVPSNIIGYQFAHTGNAYAGLAPYVPNSPEPFREFLQSPLISPLDPGKTYAIEFYVCHAELSPWAIDRMGIYLSVGIPAEVDCGTGMYIPQVEQTAGQVISDTSTWVKISGTYTAIGGENYITIGNFYNDVNTTTQYCAPASPALPSYYFIDDVSVACIDTSCDTSEVVESRIEVPNVFTPNGDGVNDGFMIEAVSIKSLSCEVYNRWGIKIVQLDLIGQGWDGRTTSGQDAAEGVYYYVVRAKDEEGKEISRTGFIQLLR